MKKFKSILKKNKIKKSIYIKNKLINLIYMIKNKKFYLIFIFIFVSCGFEPIYFQKI